MDARGRTLPRSDWPDDRHAPEPLEFVRRFCNTTNLESGADRLDEAADFDAWLRHEGRPTIDAGEADRDRLAELRETIRVAAAAHVEGDAEADAGALESIARHGASSTFRFDPGGRSVPFRTDAAPGTTDQLVAELVLGVADALTTGTWARLTACSNCRWVVYDASKNRSARWCSMSACGGRDKVRNHRARRRA